MSPCSCALEATDEPATTLPADLPQTSAPPQRGLEQNPGVSKNLVEQSHSYFPDKCASCAFYNPSASQRLKDLFVNRKKDCFNCPFINKALPDPKGELYKERRREYSVLKQDPNYKDVWFDKKTSGLKASHVGHVVHKGDKAERFFEGLTSSQLEELCKEQLFKKGHKVIFCDETKKSRGNFLPSLDMELDGKRMDIRSVTGRGWYSNIFVVKNKQLIRFNKRDDITDKADSLCLYFHDAKLFDEEKMSKSINYFKFMRDNDGTPLKLELKHVYCVIRGEEEVLIYDI